MKKLLALSFTLAIGAGCAPTSVQTTYASGASLPPPRAIYVYDFTGHASEVHLDRGLGAKLENLGSEETPTQEKIALGRMAARALSEELVQRLRDLGLPAERAFGAPTRWGNALVIEGQFVTLAQGNQTERLVIGLGAGASDMQTRVQVYATGPGGLQPVQEFATDVASGMKPGMAETMGVGAAADTLGTAAVAGAGLGIASEEFSAGVKAEAKRTAKAIVEQLQPYFLAQGWISAP